MVAAHFALSTDDRVIITGATGTGKTIVAKRLILPYIPPTQAVIIIDPKRDSHWRDIPDVKMGHPLASRLRFPTGVQIEPGTTSAYRFPKGSDDELSTDPGYRDLMRAVWNHGNCTVISDETQLLYDGPHTMDEATGRNVRAGRQRNIGFVWLMQKPSNVPTVILSEAEHWFVFTLRRADDRDRVADYLDDETLEEMPPQEEGGRSHYFFYGNVNQAKARVYRLHLPEEQQQPREETAA